jgi:hypothetical protein
LLGLCTGVFGEDFPTAVEKPIKKSIAVRQATQKAEDTWAAEKATLEARYETLKQKQDQLIAVRNDLDKQVASHGNAVQSLENKISEISRISSGLEPFMEEVFHRLNEWVERDLPFLLNERKERLGNLRKALEDGQISTSEKFRKLIEALFIEAEYGNTVEVYQESIEVSGNEILVSIFRLGRISLFFQSLDQTQTGYFDPAKSIWKSLPEAFNRDINAAVEMGTKRRSVDIITLPVGRILPE